jgi:exonuclease SbcD
MVADLRILHLADSHIGTDLPGRPRSGRRRRGDDIIASYCRVLALARDRYVDLVIHAGDVFDRPHPNDAALAAAAQPLLQLAVRDIPVVIVPGNHERSSLPEALLFSHPNLHVVRQPGTLIFNLRGTRVAIAAFPCARRQSARCFAELLRATGWQQARAEVNVLAVHQTFESATCGPAGYRFRSGDDVVERDAVPAAFDYVAAGHIHRHQVLETPSEDGPPIVYPGSPDRISFAERDEPKGAVLIEADGRGLTYRFVQHAVRSMQLVPLNVTGITRAQMRDAVLAQVTALPPECVTLLRLSGQTTRATMRGLDLPRVIRAVRPDALVTVSLQAVEFVPERHRRRQSPGRGVSVFAQLDAPHDAENGVILCPASERSSLPASCGTYALHDADGRLLYVGKAKNVRARVATHLTGRPASGHFAGWTRQIARIEARVAHSELEALLVEAELIRRLQPSFNRQMRLWSRYRYLCENGEPHGQLSVCMELQQNGACFGPYRGRAVALEVLEACADFFGTAHCPANDEEPPGPRRQRSAGTARLCRRYFDGKCVGPCAGRASDAQYEHRRCQRNALLAGEDDESLAVAERELELEQNGLSEQDELGGRERARQLSTLRSAFGYGAVLRRAEALLDGLLLLPGPQNSRTLVTLTTDGISLDTLRAEVADAQRVLAKYRQRGRVARTGVPGRLPKATADTFCTAIRELRRGRSVYPFVSADSAEALTAHCLLALAGLVD